MAWEENPRICLHMQLIAILSRTEVFFNPYLNGDRPDVLIMRKDYGVMVNLEIQANQRDFLKIQTVL